MSFSKKRLVFSAVAVMFALGLFACAWVYQFLQGSLPQLEGTVDSQGLNDAVTIQRDAQGIPTIDASHPEQGREDTAFALGWLHAQERFFQMDLLRRNSAGELSVLFGEKAVKFDSKMRLHQFRQRAQRAVEALPIPHKDILMAYTQGVNEGLNHLDNKPFEYGLIGLDPAPWQPEDSALVLLSMYIDLQPEWSETERSFGVMKSLLPEDWFAFLTSQGGEWDAPLTGEPLKAIYQLPKKPLKEFQLTDDALAAIDYAFEDQIHLGSNNWSVNGSLTRHGVAMVADDMHLTLRAPNIWYRASWYVNAEGERRRVTGASLPGAPAIVVGSNEHIAWGFTNSQGDYHDVIVLNLNEDKTAYMTPDGWQSFEIQREDIDVKGQPSQPLDVKRTVWGPVIGENEQGQWLAMRWVAHDVEGINFRLLDFEQASTVQEAIAIGNEAGVPGQNLNVVDRTGQNAWTIMGRLPKRFGMDHYDGHLTLNQLPQDWSKGDKGWSGYLTSEEYPKVINPAHGRIWTANARVVSDDDLTKVGIHRYALGARQKQIRDDLFALEQFTPQDFLDIQLDDRALFLTRWQQHLFELLTQANQQGEYDEALSLLQRWEGRASATSVGYRMVKRFREAVVDKTVGEVFRFVKQNSNEFWPTEADNFIEYPVWQLISERPAVHIPAGFDSWDAFELAAIDDVLMKMTENGEQPLSQATWGQVNMLNIAHPITKALPVLSGFLNMPAEPMSGDTYMPRVQKPSSGASQRFAVSPGREHEGYFHMATGQSGHPMSPYYDVGHQDWVQGIASPFLPQQTQWVLTLQPEQ